MGSDSTATQHWTRVGPKGESVINVMLANHPTTKRSIAADGHATGSDHEVIESQGQVDIQ